MGRFGLVARAALLFATMGIGACEPAAQRDGGGAPRAEAPPLESSAPSPTAQAATADIAAPDAPKSIEAVIEPAAAAAYDQLFEFLATNCYTDELGPSAYGKTWLMYGIARERVAGDAPFPVRDGTRLPGVGSAEAKTRATALREAWLRSPTSRVVDCKVYVPRRACDHCFAAAHARPHLSGGPQTIRYAAYLPAKLFRDPAAIRSMLVLVPGGNGGRSRPFLAPLPNVSIKNKGSGGLETQRRVDEYLAANPKSTAPIVVALESSGEESPNGASEFLSVDLPNHIADVYLGRTDGESLALGLEGVSSGSRSIVRLMHERPDAVTTAGLSCLACGGVDPRTRRLGKREELASWSEKLAKRVGTGDLAIRFAIGSRDNQLPCNRALYDLWADGGALKDSDFVVYEGALHDYAFLERSYPDQLTWHLARLSEIAARRDAR